MKKFFAIVSVFGSMALATATWAGSNSFHNVEVACTRSPIGAAFAATNYYPSGDMTTCPDRCAKWVSTCKSWATAASTCLKSEASKTASLEKTVCTTPACKQAVGSDLEDFLDNLIINTNDAKDACASNETNCVSACENPI